MTPKRMDLNYKPKISVTRPQKNFHNYNITHTISYIVYNY